MLSQKLIPARGLKRSSRICRATWALVRAFPKANPRKGTETFSRGLGAIALVTFPKANPRKGTETQLLNLTNHVQSFPKANPRKGTETVYSSSTQ